MNIKEKLKIIVDSCESKKGINIKVMDIGEMTSIADYFVIVSGNSSTQVSALSDEIVEKMEESGFDVLNSEGQSSNRWILLDYGDIIVHVFHKDEREYYDIERLWTNEEFEDIKEEN
ncbi:MAG: ribosome silencing factor [Tissierellia bacterium]|nr:ribosome silencing factor [Tissierellia bacterium]